MFILFLTHYIPTTTTMASTKSEIELSPVPTKDEVNGKPDEENAGDDVIQSQLARIKHFQRIVAPALIWLRIIAVCGIALGIVFIVIHNMFAFNEKDVPVDVTKNLYKMLEAQSGFNIGSITQQWRQVTNPSSG